jgi:ketosteroid isomerase-like protein
MNEIPKLVRAPKFLLALAAALLLASCAPRAATVDTAAGAKQLTQLDDDWSKAAGAKDVDRVASFYAQDAIAYPPGAPAAVGLAAAKQVWAAYFADSTFSISWKTEHAHVGQGGDLGYTSGTYEDSYKGPDGAMVQEAGKYLCVWAKQADGSWKAVHDMWNADK